MRLPKTVLFVLAASLAFGVSSSSMAVETTVESDASPAVVSPTHGLFSSWFGAVPQATSAGDDANDAGASRSLPSLAPPRPGDLVVGALGLLGIAYRLGGNTPDSGFDCSGLVRYVFQNTLGRDLPRRAEEISRVGARIDRAELKPGDLVFYRTLRKAFSHVGIYLGDNRFIHAPSTGGAVRVDDMSQSYWATRFTGARRIGS